MTRSEVHAPGPGTPCLRILDSLYTLDPEALRAGARIE